jgi:hypothetical protein
MPKLFFVREREKLFQYPFVKRNERFVFRTQPHLYHASILDIHDYDIGRSERFLFRKSKIGADYDPTPRKNEKVQQRYAFLVEEVVGHELRYLDIGPMAFDLVKTMFELHGYEDIVEDIKSVICAGTMVDVSDNPGLIQPIEIVSPISRSPDPEPVVYIDEESGWFERYVDTLRELTAENEADMHLLCVGDGPDGGPRIAVGEEFKDACLKRP